MAEENDWFHREGKAATIQLADGRLYSQFVRRNPHEVLSEIQGDWHKDFRQALIRNDAKIVWVNIALSEESDIAINP